MTDKELLRALGLYDRTITLNFNNEYTQTMIEKKIDTYLKKIEEERKREETIKKLKQEHEEFKEKKKFVDTFKDTFVYGKIKDTLMRDGFIYRCPFCYDVSGQYGKPIQCYTKHNKK